MEKPPHAEHRFFIIYCELPSSPSIASASITPEQVWEAIARECDLAMWQTEHYHLPHIFKHALSS
eukprot:361635-Chlamydomonas_euryale.AAC.4